MKAGHLQAADLAVEVGGQIAILGQEGAGEVDVAAEINFGAFVSQIHAETLGQVPVFADQLHPAAHLDAFDRPQRDRQIFWRKQFNPRAQKRPGVHEYFPGTAMVD